MVFLTAQLWLRSRLTDRYWRVQEVLQHARHFRGRKNRCYRLAVRAVTRAFVKCTKARRLKKRNMRTVSADPGRLGSAGLPPPLPLGPRGPLGPDFSVLSTALGSLDPVSHFTSETPANAACSTDGVWDTQGRSWAGGRASSPVPLLGPPWSVLRTSLFSFKRCGGFPSRKAAPARLGY
ncbi:39S ribosomal protein L20, mitochondrial isoform X1 [Ursus arctos]|uniref:39S ribosomal protein L20, mitochondrial isoform X1 n=1 Tax=Ursus arctos TaxID=9644 RepID=UPI002549A5C5|nr:39S ribosomal protein L20, mitochondrial isoform X1 [Ursus arctos]